MSKICCIVSREIERALQVIAEWNPGWSPKNFLVDYSEPEIGAVERVFPGRYTVCAVKNTKYLSGEKQFRK